jgi:ribonuclease P protein component
MLKKTHTIRKQTEIQDVFRLGKTYKTKGLLLKIKENNLEKYRMTVIVSSKVNAKAVYRNKIKRQIKSFFIEEIKEKKYNKDFIFITLKEINNLDSQEIKNIVNTLMTKI